MGSQSAQNTASSDGANGSPGPNGSGSLTGQVCMIANMFAEAAHMVTHVYCFLLVKHDDDVFLPARVCAGSVSGVGERGAIWWPRTWCRGS